MKVALLIAFVVLELLMETAMAQLCVQPTCRRGALLDTLYCRCNGDTDSTCASGFKPIIDNEHGHCSCESRILVKCKTGFLLDEDACKCKISSSPTCPDGSLISPSNSLCKGEHIPYCPSGYIKHGCECVKEYVRRCSSGTLSNNGCKCSSTYSPICSSECRLNSRSCTCDAEIKCFDNLYCFGYGRTVYSVFECCGGFEGPTLQPVLSPADAEISSISHSYRIGYGSCTQCYH